MRSQLQLLGFYLAGFVCVVLAILKLTIEGHWSWWRVLLPLWVVLGHNAVYIAVGFAWLRFADDGEATIRPNDGASAYQLAAMLCFLIFADNLLGRIEGTGRDCVVGTEIGLVGADRGVRCLKRDVPISVLDDGNSCGKSSNLGRVAPE